MPLSNPFILKLILLFPTWLTLFGSTSKSYSTHGKSLETWCNSFSSENTLFLGELILFSPELISFLDWLISVCLKLISFQIDRFCFFLNWYRFHIDLFHFLPNWFRLLLSPPLGWIWLQKQYNRNAALHFSLQEWLKIMVLNILVGYPQVSELKQQKSQCQRY